MRQKSTVLGMAAATAFSGATFSALAGPCTTATLNTYISGANTGCTVLDKTITGMSLTGPSGIIPASSVTVHPVTAANDPGLNFVIANFATFNTQNATISFTIAAPSSDPMTDASLAVAGQLFTANSSFQDSETLSNGISLLATNSQLTASTTFAATTSLNVTNALTVTDARLTQFTNRFSETPVTAPEPSSLALLGVGLSALGFVRRRKRL